MIIIEEVIEKSKNNPQAELLFVGALYKSPDLYISYGIYIRSKYDFSDEATRFFYDCFENMYLNFSQTVDENKVNIFMSQDDTRLRQYRHYGGYKLLKKWMSLASIRDIKSYFDTVKKYSLVREYYRMGNPGERILNYKKFDSMKSSEVYRLVRTNVDKINTVINANEESVDLTSKATHRLKSLLISPDMGVPLPWDIMSSMVRGCRLGKLYLNGFLSNAGKTRNLMVLMAFIVLVLNEKFLLLSNEMDEDDLENCLITTVLNNPYFKQLHGIDITKPESEIALGLYRDDSTGEFLERKVDENGNFVESEEDYMQRVYNSSTEFKKVLKVTEWIDRKKEANLMFKDVGGDYSDKTIEFELRKAKMVHGIRYCGYDTLKGFGTDDWQTLKQTATKLKETVKELKMFCFAVYQLTDESVNTDIFQFSSNNIANAKQMKHVCDVLMLGRQIKKEEYKKYQYIGSSDWGENTRHELDVSKTYFAIVMDKNRGGNKKHILLFEIDLDLNTWLEIGTLVRRERGG